jgi:transposase-like protein
MSRPATGANRYLNFSQLALACRNGKPRAIRDRFSPEEYQRLVEAAQAGACNKRLAAEFGISRRSIERLAVASIAKAAGQ